jgi:hypothetical protein
VRRFALVLLGITSVLPLTTARSATPPQVRDVLVRSDTGAGEPQLAVDPRHPQDVVVGENNLGVSVSHDRGLHWTHVSLPNQGDNTTTIDAAGVYAYTSLDGAVLTSRDRGRTWANVGNWVGSLAEAWYGVGGSSQLPFRFLGCNAPRPTGPVDPVTGPGFHVIGCDRPWLTADATRPGLLRVAFTDHSDGSGGTPVPTVGCKTSTATNQVFSCGRQYVATSRDGGRTWGAFVPVDSAAAPMDHTNGFSGIPMSRAGVLATSYLAGASPGSRCTTCVIFQISRDDGRTWSRHLVPVAVDGASLGAHELNPLGISSSLAFEPYVAQDPSRPGRYAVMVYDSAQRTLLVHVTGDFGRTWTGPARLAERGGKMRWLPWIAYGPTGALGVMWRTAFSEGSYEVWAAVSPSGSIRFARPVRLSSQRSPGPVSQVAADDASFVALDGTTLHAAWGDRREGTLGIHYGRYSFASDPAVQALR